MGLFGKIKNAITGKTEDYGTALVYVFGEDKRYTRRNMVSTGVYFQDEQNRLAFDSFPASIGVLSRVNNGRTRTMGPVSIAYEPTTKMFNFPVLTWSDQEHKDDVILDTAFAEGCSRAIQNEDRQQLFERLTQILLWAVLGVMLLAFIIAAQSGLLANPFANLPRLFR